MKISALVVSEMTDNYGDAARGEYRVNRKRVEKSGPTTSMNHLTGGIRGYSGSRTESGLLTSDASRYILYITSNTEESSTISYSHSFQIPAELECS
jgi:hypothetical protein